MTRSPHRVTSTSTSPAARAAAAIWPAVIAAAGRSPNTLSWARPAASSAGPRGHRSVEMSVMLSTPPGRSTRWHSSKNARRERKWNAASTLISPSAAPLASGSRAASPATGTAAASRSRSLPADSCHSAMFTAISRRGRALSAITGSWVPRPFPTSATTPPGGSADATVWTSRRQAAPASSSVPGPSHSPRFSQPGASATKQSEPMLS